MKEEFPTPRELMSLLGYCSNSCEYGTSRTILNVLDEPVLAYGLGFAGFICVYKSKTGLLNAVGYSIQGIMTNYKKASFAKVELKEALTHIEHNKFLVEKQIDKKRIDEALQVRKKSAPVLGRFTIKRPEESFSKTQTFHVRQFKNGRFYAVDLECRHATRIYTKDILKLYNQGKQGKYQAYSFRESKNVIRSAYLENDTMTEELLTKMGMYVASKEI